jgi:hypothetical protein
MTMQNRAVRAGGVQLLLLMGFSGCGATAATGPASAEAEPVATPTSALELAPNDGELSATAEPSATVSADEGSGIPPGVPDEGSPAYELLINRLCKELAPDEPCNPEGSLVSGDWAWLSGGTNGEPRRLVLYQGGGCLGNYRQQEWVENTDGSWAVGDSESYEAPDESFEEIFHKLGASWNPQTDVRYPTDAEVATAESELATQHPNIHRGAVFIDLNRDGQTEAIEWKTNYCRNFAAARVYSRGQDGQWNNDSVATETYFGTDWPEDE